jgi:riboflavin kinase/FMN adenylyltransferase
MKKRMAKKTSKPTAVVAIGVFDGVHLGHRALLSALARLAHQTKATPIALTFRNHPEDVLAGGPRVPFLLEREASFRLLKKYGAEKVYLIPFTKAFAKRSAENFVNWMCDRFDLKGVVVGTDFRFGKGAEGDAEYLRREGLKRGFKVVAVTPIKVGGVRVSSNRIRQSLQEGRLDEANRLLDRPYELLGLVAHGKHVGHQIGFPTANLSHVPQVLPKDGVYACSVPIYGKLYRAAMNLGKRPTFKDDDHHRSAEVHVIGFHKTLYGKTLRVQLLKYLRPEKRFLSITELTNQIKRDLAKVNKVKLPKG